jgi:hypothetical protein
MHGVALEQALGGGLNLAGAAFCPVTRGWRSAGRG